MQRSGIEPLKDYNVDCGVLPMNGLDTIEAGITEALKGYLCGASSSIAKRLKLVCQQLQIATIVVIKSPALRPELCSLCYRDTVHDCIVLHDNILRRRLSHSHYDACRRRDTNT
jgi:hypothetical protein